MDTLSSPEESPIGGKEGFLSVLPEGDRANVEALTRLFQQAMTDQGREGTLLTDAVMLLRPLDRSGVLPLPIIPLTVALQPQDPAYEYPNEASYARKDFTAFQELISAMVKASNNQFQVSKTYQPAIDEQFSNPDILKHPGSVELTDTTNQGLTIRITRQKYTAVLNNKGVVVLAAVYKEPIPGPEQTENPEDKLRKEGAIIAIRSVDEELIQPLSVLSGYWELGERTNTFDKAAIGKAISDIKILVRKYDKAAEEGNFGFAKYGELDVLSVHAHAEKPSKT